MEGKDHTVDITVDELGYECIIPKVDTIPGNKIIFIQHKGAVVRTMDYDKDYNIGCSFKLKNIQYSEKGLETMAKLGAVK